MASYKVIEENGVKYTVINCSKCGQELRFKMTNEKRRIHGVCSKCMREFEVEVDRV